MSYPFQITSLDQYYSDYNKSVEAPESFWSQVAENFTWRKKWNTVLNWNFKEPFVEWFSGGKLNITENCIDRHQAHHPYQPDQLTDRTTTRRQRNHVRRLPLRGSQQFLLG